MDLTATSFQFKKGELHAESVPLSKIIKKLGTPAYVYSTDAFLSPLKKLQAGLKDLPHTVCFALKSNSNIHVLRLLARSGAGFDIVSGGELFRAQQAGALGSRIVFSGVGKTEPEVTAALKYGKKGIYSFNVESVAELDLINRVAGKLKRMAPIALRFNPDVDAKTHPYISTGLKENKFGLDRSEVLSAIRSWSRFPHLNLKGISIHIGSQLLDLSPIEDSFKKVRELLEEIGPLLPSPLEFVDLGGGLGIQYSEETPPSIESYCELVQKHFGPRSGLRSPLKILLEPGRTLSGNAGVLVTQVLFRKSRKEKEFLIVDAAMNDLIRPSLYGSFHSILPLQEKRLGEPTKTTDVVGPVCESSDFLAETRDLSETLNSGDLLAVMSAGAYGFSMSSQYNSRPRAVEVLVKGKSFHVIRKRESYTDLIRGEK